MRVIAGMIIYHLSFAVCQGACHLALAAPEELERPPVVGHPQELPDCQVVVEVPQGELVGHQAHRSWVEERDHQAQLH
jgi:hypothetical protein